MADDFLWLLVLCYLLILSQLVTTSLSDSISNEFDGFSKSLADLFSMDDEECKFSCPNGEEPAINKRHVPSSNGCGSFGIKVTATEMPGMTACCDKHDICYDTCGTQKSECDNAFHTCLSNICTKMKRAKKSSTIISDCESAVALMYGGTATFGCTAFTSSQEKACVCSGGGKRRKTEQPTKPRRTLRMPNLDDDWLHDEF